MDPKTFLLALVVALLMGSAAIFEKASLKEATPLTIFTLRSLYMTLVLIGIVLWSGEFKALAQVSRRTWILIVTPATFALLFIGIYFSILKQDLASRVVPIVATAPLFTLLFSILFLGEPFTWRRLVGVLLIVGGVTLVK